MSQQLQEILHFAQKTGDKVIVTDNEGKEPMVILPFTAYQSLVERLGSVSFTPVSSENESEEIDALADLPEEFFATESNNVDDLALEIPEAPTKQNRDQIWPVSGSKKVENTPALAETDTSDAPEEEEQFYLEPVE
ncbi:hypothetical protein COV06_02580 [Candidatus Uhrbacteria bacterium CG10_big_fil_rev_8_21_14_0_10_50_16]|uniref:Antitoxin n=1 Tax=Candidatus Uhrbacteria bacterium CG10_big_fil_rev_8_21_14_0_10_50_16 TaxID=1975039 RepID=A0A2H0RM84_9BACT|nr:MAG: hypothetical protein COV06_02580 [Candidatus Uhrbacteria bacterium CG10_big_fil_rev_8_21_14_0_10_50_16]